MKNILERLSTPELDERLQAELKKDIPDGNLVREIIRVLEYREKDYKVEVTPQIQAAWDKFKAEDQRRADRPRPTARSWVIRAASVAAVLCLLLATVIPQPVQAETLWERIVRWTSEAFEFLNPVDAKFEHSQYVFQTDNPGLQQVYDAVVELGVTDPVVPMWLPVGYELEKCITDDTSTQKSLIACFLCGEDSAIFKVKLFNSDVWHEYHKDAVDVGEYETNGIIHKVMPNKGMWFSVWERENIECSIILACQEDTLYKIIDSIYSSEGK